MAWKVTDEQVRAQWQRLVDEEPELTTARAATEIGIAAGTLAQRARTLGLPKLRSIRRTAAARAAVLATLLAGRETQRAARFPNLASGREAQRAAGFPALARGRETNRAAGFPNLVRGTEAHRKITDDQVEWARSELIRDESLTVTEIARDLGVRDNTLGFRLGIYRRPKGSPHFIDAPDPNVTAIFSSRSRKAA